jgi:hypothetical protein
MDSAHEDSFVVYERARADDGYSPEIVERPLATCATYEEAREVRRAHLAHAPDCVIRFLGLTGGGD